MNRPLAQVVLAAELVLGLAVPALAQGPTQFQNGQVADANAVNTNFQTVLAAAEQARSSANLARATATGIQTAAAIAQATADQADADANSALGSANAANATATATQSALTALSSAMTFAAGIFDGPVLGSFTAAIADPYLSVRTHAATFPSTQCGVKLRTFNENIGFTLRYVYPTGLHIRRYDNDAAGTDALHVSRSSGFVGIGTTSPNVALQVDGEIALGPNGSDRPIADAADSRLIRGSVSASGVGLTPGNTYLVVHVPGSGVYQIIFAALPFSAPPVVTASLVDGAGAPNNTICVDSVSSTGFHVHTYGMEIQTTLGVPTDLVANAEDAAFTFLVVAPLP